MRSSSDQRVSDSADQEPSDDTAAAAVEEVIEGSSEEAAQETSEAEEEFEGFDGSWDYEWVATAEATMEAIPWTWIAVAVFIGGMVYSYRKQKRS